MAANIASTTLARISRNTDFILAVGVISIIMVLVLPLAPILLERWVNNRGIDLDRRELAERQLFVDRYEKRAARLLKESRQ